MQLSGLLQGRCDRCDCNWACNDCMNELYSDTLCTALGLGLLSLLRMTHACFAMMSKRMQVVNALPAMLAARTHARRDISMRQAA